MNNIKNTIIKYYIIKIGALFYAGGLHSIIFENYKPENYSVTDNEGGANLIFIEEEAKAIAKKLKGQIISKENSILEINNIIKKRDVYINNHSQKTINKSCC